MDTDLAPLFETTKRLALLAETLKQQTTAAIKEQHDAGQLLNDTAYTFQGNVGQLVGETVRQVGISARAAVDSALAESIELHSRSILEVSSSLQQTTRHLENSLGAVARETRRLVWISYASIAGAVLLLVAGGGMLLHHESQAYDAARTRAAQADIGAATIEAYARAGLASCGGRPCLKLDQKTPHWGAKGEYVLVEGATAAKKEQAAAQ
jgi:hypothetical protein